MSDEVQLALISAMPALLVALGTFMVVIKTGWKVDGVKLKADKVEQDVAHNTSATIETSQKADVINEKASAIIEKAAEIHTSTNGTLSVVSADLKVAHEKIRGLEHMLTELMGAREKVEAIALAKVQVPQVTQINGKG